MSKGLLTKVNSNIGDIIEYYPNRTTTRHSIHFENEGLRGYWIARYLYTEANYDWKTELENQPEFAFIQNTSTSGVFSIKVQYYVDRWGETINSLLNKDSAMIKNDDGTYALYNLSGAVNEGEKNITYKADLNIPFTYQLLNLLKNEYLIKRTHANSDFINLDSSKNENNIQQNFIKREMFDLTTRETMDDVNISSIFLFYTPKSSDNVSQHSLYNVKIIPICSGVYYPNDRTSSNVDFNSTLTALNYIYNLKDPLLEFVMVLPETPYISKELITEDGITYWDGSLNYNREFIDYDYENNIYIFNLKNDSLIIQGYIFSGIWKFNNSTEGGDYAPKTIPFSQSINKDIKYQFDYGLIYLSNSKIEHKYMDLNGNVFPNIGETKIIFFDGGTTERNTTWTNNLNAGDYSDRILYNSLGIDDPATEGFEAIWPIKITNIDDYNYYFETAKGSDLYNLYNQPWYYYNRGGLSKDGTIPNNDNLWGKDYPLNGGGTDDQIIFKNLNVYENNKTTAYNFIYRIDLKNYITNEYDIHLFQSGVKNLKIGVPNTDFNLKVPFNYLNNDFIYIVGVLDFYKLTCNYFLLLNTYDVNSYESNFAIENVQINAPSISNNYLSWYNSNKTSRVLGRIESSILIVGGLTTSFISPLFANKKKVNLIGWGLTGGGVFKGLSMFENRKNLEHSPAKITTGDNMFINFIQPQNSIYSTISNDNKITNFDFSIYSWEEVPENQYQNNKINELRMHGITVENLVTDWRHFGEKKRYQYFEILDCFENIQAPLSQEIKQKINEIFEEGITFWFFRSDLVFNGIKNYEQDNPFVDEE